MRRLRLENSDRGVLPALPRRLSDVEKARASAPGSGAPMTAIILPFTTQTRIRNCIQCGTHFRPQAAHHRLCSTCYWWNRGLRALAIANKAFNELRAGGT
jgi:hypothetical protein